MKRTALSILLVILLGLGGSVWYLLNSQWGLDLTYNLVRHTLPGKLSIQSLQGKLLGPITAHGIRYESNEFKLVVDEMQLDWRPVSFLRGTLQLTTIDAHGIDIELVNTGTAINDDANRSLILPFAIELTNAQLTDITITKDEQPIYISRIALQVTARDENVQLTQLIIKSERLDLTTDGKFGLTETQAAELHTTWIARFPDLQPLQGSGKLAGSLTNLEVEQSIKQPGIDVKLHGRLNDVLSHIKWYLTFDVTQLSPRQLSSSWPAITTQGKLTSEGNLDAFIVAGDLLNNVPEHGELQTQFKIHATPDVWLFDRLHAKHTPTSASLDATGKWKPGPDLGMLSLAGSWKRLVLPLKTDQQAHFVSNSGQFTISGRPANYQFDTHGDLTGPNLPQMEIAIVGNGNLKQVNLTSITAKTLDGIIRGSAFASWEPQLSWKGTLRAKSLNPAIQWHDWPGQLNAEIRVSGKTTTDKITTTRFELKRLNGKLRDYPVEAHAKVDWGDGNINIHEVKLDIGDSQLRASGRRDNIWNMQAALNSPDLNALCPYSRGKLTADIALSGARATPHVIANITGEKISFQDTLIGQIKGDIDIDLQSDERFTTLITASDLIKGSRQWQSLKFLADGSRTQHQIHLELRQEMDLVQLVIDAGLNKHQIWRGQISRTVFKTDKFGEWQQTQPALFSFDIHNASLNPWCLTQPGASICLQGNKQQNVWNAELKATQLPLNLLEKWLPTHLEIHGRANLDTRLHYVKGRELTGGLHVDIPKGFRLEVPDKSQSFQFGAGNLNANLNDAGLEANFDLPANDLGNIKMVLRLPDWHALSGLPASQPLNGYIKISLVSLDRLNGFFLDSPNLTGSFMADLRLGGTVGTPSVIGESKIDQASADIPALGIKLEKINLRASSQSGKKIDYQFSSRSGKGAPLTVTGYTLLQSSEGWPTKLQVRGNNFQLANLPDTKIDISPSLDIEVKGRRINLEGTVTVPHARFHPRALPKSSVSPSQDVVITDASELPEIEEHWKVFSNVRVILGDHVYFDGFGLKGELSGNVLLIDEPGKQTVGQGEIRITEGTYRAYGQDAKIRRGRLMFANTFIDDPGIDLEAVREIDNVTAGVRVRGTLKQPELTLFSEPVMSESDIISYFLLGRPIEETTGDDEGAQLQKAILAARLAGGELIVDQTGIYTYVDEVSVEADNTTEQTSLVIGKYLSPKIYVRYITGIIESSNIVEIQYKLSKFLRIQTEAGYRNSQAITGADIYYTIEY